MEIIKAKQLSAHLNKIPFFEEINTLEKGGGIKIKKSEWKKKSPPRQYYQANINVKEKVVKISDAGDHWLIIKL